MIEPLQAAHSVNPAMSQIFELLIIKLLLPVITSHVTLYLAKPESGRLFGVNHAVYYIRRGVLNMFAQNMNQGSILPSSVHHIDFSWTADTPHIPYRVTTTHTGWKAAHLVFLETLNVVRLFLLLL